MNNFKPDPEFWKKSTYSTLWEKHMNNVKELDSALLDKFPELKGCIKVGHGAKTDEWIKIPPDEKNEPDLSLFKDYKCLCHIEVSGSDSPKAKMPNTIWIRPGKIAGAESNGGDYFFYMVYLNEKRLVDIETAKKYKDKVITVGIKTNKETGKKIPEKYCEIPYEESKSTDVLFDWIEQKLKNLR